MKNTTSVNTESIVFIVDDDMTRRMLMMYLAAVGLDARTYCSSMNYLARHDFSRIRHLVLDMQLPGMEGAILQRTDVADGESAGDNAGTFQLIPIKNNTSFEPWLPTRFASQEVIVDDNDITFPGFEE